MSMHVRPTVGRFLCIIRFVSLLKRDTLSIVALTFRSLRSNSAGMLSSGGMRTTNRTNETAVPPLPATFRRYRLVVASCRTLLFVLYLLTKVVFSFRIRRRPFNCMVFNRFRINTLFFRKFLNDSENIYFNALIVIQKLINR